MNVDELRSFLRAGGVAEETYLIDVTGAVTPLTVGELHDIYVLTRLRPGLWFVFYVEHGDVRRLAHFVDEDDACQHLATLFGRGPAQAKMWPKPVRYLCWSLLALILGSGLVSIATSGPTAAAAAGLRVAISVAIAGLVGSVASGAAARRKARRRREETRDQRTPRSHAGHPDLD